MVLIAVSYAPFVKQATVLHVLQLMYAQDVKMDFIYFQEFAKLVYRLAHFVHQQLVAVVVWLERIYQEPAV
jgi:hypothetical protein